MSEMIERVARAICKAQGIDDADARAQLHPAGEVALWETRTPEALAAIQAMREPTEAMTSSIYDKDFDIFWAYRANGSPGAPGDVWRAMIDEALK